MLALVLRDYIYMQSKSVIMKPVLSGWQITGYGSI